MKKILILLLMAIIISSCCTTEYVEVPVEIKPEFEPVPERELLKGRQDDESVSQFLLGRVNYFKSLVELWESWGVSVYESVDEPLPESLLWLKNSEEN